VWQTTHTDVDRATAAIDPTGGGVLLRIGNFGGANVPVAIDLATGVGTVAAFSGPTPVEMFMQATDRIATY